MVIKSIRKCFVYDFKVTVFGHAVGQQLGGFEVVQAIDRADGFAVVVTDKNNPHGNFLAFVVNIGLGSV